MCVACVLYILFSSKKQLFTVCILKYLGTGMFLWLKNSLFSVAAVIFVHAYTYKSCSIVTDAFSACFLILWILLTLLFNLLCLLKEWFQKSTDTEGVSCDAA